ncbi:MAG: glycosyltransferase family 2 protein, partial [bacterium]|nr:glycosyltransferase family 2 protein [bacterium]
MKNLEQFPEVSVVILVYNGEKFISPLLESIQDQSYPAEKTEVLLVDNGSTDNTVAKAKEFDNVKVILLGQNYGYTGGNNRAPAYAGNDLIVFLNVDTICHHDWLSGLVGVLTTHKNIAACASNTVSPGDPGFDSQERYKPLDTICRSELTVFGYSRFLQQPYKKIVYSKLLSGCSFIIRREILDELGYLFEEAFWIYAEDTDLALRLRNTGRQVCTTGDSLVYHMHQSYIKASPAKIKI